MDPFSQAVLGSMAALAVVKKKERTTSLKAVALWGALGGLAPDLDILIRSSVDPLFNVQYHRHFTHSLLFIPFGALVVSLFLRLFRCFLFYTYFNGFSSYPSGDKLF